MRSLRLYQSLGKPVDFRCSTRPPKNLRAKPGNISNKSPFQKHISYNNILPGEIAAELGWVLPHFVVVFSPLLDPFPFAALS